MHCTCTLQQQLQVMTSRQPGAMFTLLCLVSVSSIMTSFHDFEGRYSQSFSFSDQMSCAKPDPLESWIMQDEEMPSPTAQQGRDMFSSDSASRAASDSASEAASRGDFGQLRIPSMGKQQNFQKRRSPEAKPACTATDKARDQVKPPSNAEAGQRGQSQYAQFLHRSSVGLPTNQNTDSQPLLRRSSSLGAASKRDAKPSDAQPSSLFSKAVASILPGKHRSFTPAAKQVTTAAQADDDMNAQKLERQPSSRVHAVAAHQSSDGDCNSADLAQEAASHREQMSGVVGGQAGGAAGAASQPQACPQPKRKPPERQLTFQEMLRQQIEVRFW